MEDGDEEEIDDDIYRSMFLEHADTRMEDTKEEEAEERQPDEPLDDLGQVISDAKRGCDINKERLQFEQTLQDHKTLLYPNCEDGQKKLGSTLKLLRWR